MTAACLGSRKIGPALGQRALSFDYILQRGYQAQVIRPRHVTTAECCLPTFAPSSQPRRKVGRQATSLAIITTSLDMFLPMKPAQSYPGTAHALSKRVRLFRCSLLSSPRQVSGGTPMGTSRELSPWLPLGIGLDSVA